MKSFLRKIFKVQVFFYIFHNSWHFCISVKSLGYKLILFEISSLKV